jgi:molecular chaperone DnaJ
MSLRRPDLLSVDSIGAMTKSQRGMEDFYELLGVQEDASTEEINRAWREQVHQYHPDVNDDTRANAQFKTLKAAHEVLSDETERSAYDRLGHETYVQERLDGLPSTRHPATDDSTGRTREKPDRNESDGDDGGSDRTGSTGGARTDRSDSRSSGGGDPAGSAGTGRTRTTNAGTAGERSRGAHTRSDATSTATNRRKSPRRPLAYGWAAIAVASVVYLLGLWAYLGENAAAVATLLEAPPATLPSVLLGTHGLVAPGTFVLDAAATGAMLPLVFAAGALGLALGFLAVVASFGRGAAYLYAVGGLAPVAALAIGPFVAAPDGAILALTVVVPVATVALFLADVGRALLAGP